MKECSLATKVISTGFTSKPACYNSLNPVLTYLLILLLGRRPILKNRVGTPDNRGAHTKPGKSIPSFINILLLTQADIIEIIDKG